MVSQKNTKFFVEIDRIVLPNGEVKTTFAIPYKGEKGAYLPKSSTINKVLSNIDQKYHEFINRAKYMNLQQLNYELSIFLEDVSRYVILGGDLVGILSKELKLNKRKVLRLIKDSKWTEKLIKRIGEDYKKRNKVHPIEYSEAIYQLTKIFGLELTLKLLRKNKIKIGKSTIRRLCIVACESPKIKKLVREKKLAISLVPLLRKFNQNEKEKVAEQLILIKKYKKAREYIKQLSSG